MSYIRINRSDSRCDACGRGADMYETGHYTIREYGEENGQPGCGVEWDGVTSDYLNIPEQIAQSDDGYFFAENLRGLPVYTFFEDGPIGVYGGQTREDAEMSALRRQEDISVSDSNDLR